MKIALFGASGTIGRRILNEALARGHQVTALSRNPDRLELSHANLTAQAGDVLDSASVASAAAGYDVVISAYGPGFSSDPQLVVQAAEALLAGLPKAGVKRLVVVGGAASLEVAPGLRLIDTPQFPAAWKGIGQAHVDALKRYQANDTVEWTNISPAALIEPGERTGAYRTSGDTFLTDAEGNSRISCEDYAIAVLDEVENPQHIRQRFSVAY